MDPSGAGVIAILLSRVQQQPINGLATAIFLLAVFHTFVANRFRRAAQRTQLEFNEARRQRGLPYEPSFAAEMLNFLGEVEVVFGIWILVLLAAITLLLDWQTARAYLTERVHFVEPMFVVVIMTIAATRPVVGFAQTMLTTVGIATAVWVAATFMTAPEPEEKLLDFYRRVHPAGPGWSAIAARAGAVWSSTPERLAPGFVNWILGIVVVYSTLFLIREILFGSAAMTAVLAAVALAAAVLLSRRLR